MLSRGNLTIAILDSVDGKIAFFQSISTQIPAEYVLEKYSQPVRFTREDHVEWGMHYSIKIIINIFDNNRQKNICRFCSKGCCFWF